MKSKITEMKMLIIIGALFVSSTAYSQNKTEDKEPVRFNHSLGFGAGVSTGYGLSYRYFGEKFGTQVNFSPYKDEERTNISLGLTFLYRIVELDQFSFFVYQGNHFFYDKNSSIDYDYYSGKQTTRTTEKQFFNNGVGIGLEWDVSERIGINTMAGYGGRENFKKISITGEVAIYFRF